MFSAPSPVNPKFVFGSLGGRYILLAFLPAPGPEREAALQLVHANAHLFTDERLVLRGVTRRRNLRFRPEPTALPVVL
jgi:hypothetical protein